MVFEAADASDASDASPGVRRRRALAARASAREDAVARDREVCVVRGVLRNVAGAADALRGGVFPERRVALPRDHLLARPSRRGGLPAYGVRGLGRGLQPERRRVLRRVLRPPGGRGARAVLLRRQYRRHRGGGHRRGGSGLLPRLRRATVRRDAHRGERVPLLLPLPLRGHPRARHQRADARASGRRSDAADFVPPDAARDATTTNPDPVPDPLAPHPRGFHRRPVAVPAAPRGARRPGFPPEPEPTHPRPPVPEPPVGPSPAPQLSIPPPAPQTVGPSPRPPTLPRLGERFRASRPPPNSSPGKVG